MLLVGVNDLSTFCIRYVYCEKCFTEIEGDEVELVDDPTQPSTYVLVSA